jgi:hypothetical protein
MPPYHRPDISRRHFVGDVGLGFTGLALGSMFFEERVRAEAGAQPAATDGRCVRRADSVIWLFMMGGVSHVEGFDPKPALNRHAGRSIKAGDFHAVLSREALDLHEVGPDLSYSTKIFPLQVGFRKRGRAGIEISDWWPEVGDCADDLALVRSLYTTDTEHSAVFQFHTGRSIRNSPQPSLGSWASYGLGTLNRSLPRFVVLGFPPHTHQGGPGSHRARYLGPEHDGVPLRAGVTGVLPYPPDRVHRSETAQRRELALVQRLNKLAQIEYPDDPAVTARIRSYETAFGMQRALPEVADLTRETAATHALYGLDNPVTRPLGQQCLLARRLVERGVRFVQIYHGGNPDNDSGDWDAHGHLRANHTRMCARADRPIAGLLKDLKRRGMLHRTLVVWASEFGRTPNVECRNCAEGADAAATGRDHHIFGFSAWLAGAGIKGGVVHGATDELGFHAVEHRHYITDVHATILHLLGLDFRRLEFPGQKRLAMDRGHVIRQILA